MVIRTDINLAKAIFLLRIESGYEKQIAFASHLGISRRHYQRLESQGKFTRKMLWKIRIKYPHFAPHVSDT